MSLWEERFHPLRQEWVIVAAHRQNRPWIGETIAHTVEPLSEYVEGCTFCPGNTRVSGHTNDAYSDVFVFDNDAPCVGLDAPEPAPTESAIFQNRSARGIARVVCYSPRHDLTLAQLPLAQVVRLVEVWQEQYRDLGNRQGIDHVLIFENKGAVVGVSNPHPHGQIYATNFVFKHIETEARAGALHKAETGRVLFQDILEAEVHDGRRILFENATAIAFVPYFARYAYEVYVAPKATVQSVDALSAAEVIDFAEALSQVVTRFDNLWNRPFPYVMALHQAPTDGGDYSGFHFHAEFHPPLRKPDLLKYLAGPEIGGGNFLSDTTPEEKAAELRALPSVHYTLR
ncbi:MAG: galactose-1-phosphate uridylyltransferase [Vicinamibacteria bacterium]